MQSLILRRLQQNNYQSVLSKVDDFATFEKVEAHAKNYTLKKVEVV